MRVREQLFFKEVSSLFHLSDLKKYSRCEKYFWLSKKAPQPFFPYVTCIENTVELSKKFLGLTHYYEGETNDEGSKVLEALEDYDVFVNARFTFEDLRVTIPFLIRQETGYQVIFTFNQCFPKESEALKIADAIYVLKANQIEVADIRQIHLNADYVRKDELDVSECLILDEYLYNEKNKAHFTIKELVETQMRDVADVLKQMRDCENGEEPCALRTSACTHRGKCEYYQHCFPEEVADSSVLTLVQCKEKQELHESGVVDMAMLEGDEIANMTRHQYAQIMAAKTHSLYFDKPAMKHWVETKIEYPITYLDFEWDTYVYPPYAGMKPYDVLVFQYSMHIEKSPGANLAHEQYIGTGDCRIEFIEDLLAKIPKRGSVMVFNAVGAEMLRLKQLAAQFPQYEEALRQVWERMVDLSLPFSTGNIYDLRMSGAFSLKKLVTIFSDLDYKELEISHGMEAVQNWRHLNNDEISDEIREQLFEYCGMDTYAMVVVFRFILNKIYQ